MIQEVSDLRDCAGKDVSNILTLPLLHPPAIFLQIRFIYLLLVWGVSEER